VLFSSKSFKSKGEKMGSHSHKEKEEKCTAESIKRAGRKENSHCLSHRQKKHKTCEPQRRKKRKLLIPKNRLKVHSHTRREDKPLSLFQKKKERTRRI